MAISISRDDVSSMHASMMTLHIVLQLKRISAISENTEAPYILNPFLC